MQRSSPLYRCLLQAAFTYSIQPLRFTLAASLAVSLLLFLSPLARAQQLTDRQWAIFRETAGLLSSDVYAVLADGDAVWFGVDQGISRYDGRWQSFDLKTIVQSNRNRRPITATGRVTALAHGANHAGIWAGTDQGALLWWDGHEWALVASTSSPVHGLAEVGEQLWIGADSGLLILDDGELHSAPQFEDNPVAALAADEDGVWVGTQRGLWRSSRDGESETPIKLEANGKPLTGAIQALWADEAGDLWVGVDGQAVKYRPTIRKTTFYEETALAGSGPPVTGIGADANGSVWISTAGSGIVQYQFEDEEQISAVELTSASRGGLASNIVRSLAIDQDGSVWFATPVGVSRYQGWAWLEIDDAVTG